MFTNQYLLNITITTFKANMLFPTQLKIHRFKIIACSAKQHGIRLTTPADKGRGEYIRKYPAGFCIFTCSFVMDPKVLFDAALGCHENTKRKSYFKMC